jgi:arylsulfatase A-like enzyme
MQSISRRFAIVACLAALLGAVGATPARAQAAQLQEPPNIIFIMADDLGYGDLGCYGQQQIQTPNIDRLAREGMRFTDAYAGSTVCAPSRCVLMTGLHSGHAFIRGNDRIPLRPEDVTVADVLKGAGYATGIIGKWGLGEPDTSGVPNRQGFDWWFGYLNQRLAHNYYPETLWRNETEVRIEGNVVANNVATQRAQYSHDLFTRDALEFLNEHRQRRFFLYLAYTIPHANNEGREQGMEVPSDEPYTDRDWPQPQKNQAAMITRLDRDIGVLMDRLRELNLDERTLVFFTSDNGPHREGGGDPDFFDSNGPLRGIKRDLYEGGIRVPMIARWPGHIQAGATSDLPWAFWDVLPTLAELAGAQAPAGVDGISVLPTLLGEATVGRPQPRHEYLYWEFHEGGFKQAVRMGPYKGVRPAVGAPLEIYDLSADLAEANNLAEREAEITAQIENILAKARTDSPYWPVQGN